MKHILFVIAACLVCLNALAGSDIKVKSGKSVVVKENANAVIVFDFSNARWEQKESFKDWSGTCLLYTSAGITVTVQFGWTK